MIFVLRTKYIDNTMLQANQTKMNQNLKIKKGEFDRNILRLPPDQSLSNPQELI